MFRGHYEHSIDGKGRTSLPARFRAQLPTEGDMRMVIAPALQPSTCLDVYPMRAWEELEQRVAGLNRWDRDVMLFRRRYISAAVEVEIDRAGRVLVPASLREKASLRKEVLWAGVGKTMELWSQARWAAAQAIEDADMERWTMAVAEKLEL
ncbi:MAG: division/cell wall cluster transcriptional repressor MraZ [Myxococcota bacterium]